MRLFFPKSSSIRTILSHEVKTESISRKAGFGIVLRITSTPGVSGGVLDYHELLDRRGGFGNHQAASGELLVGQPRSYESDVLGPN
jgi:hypothetical protein